MAPTTPTFPPDTGLGRLDYSQAPAAVYFVASTGDRWRVHDCVMEGGRLVRLGSPDNPRAAYRVFVAETGVRKLYTRLKGEVWRLTPAQCDRQLAAAEYLGARSFSDTGDCTTDGSPCTTSHERGLL